MSITLKERPIIMIGAERSGTTLVMAMLGCHPRIAVPEVVWYYPRFRPYLYTYGDLSRAENLRTLAEEMVFGLKTPFWGMKVNPRTIVDEILADLKEPSFAGIYCAMHERYARSVGNKPRWGEKTPHNLFFVKEILEDFPNAQFIFITRDGRDASADYLDSAFGPTNIFCAAESWALCQNAVKPWRKNLRADQWMDLRYEELVKDPVGVLKDRMQVPRRGFRPGDAGVPPDRAREEPRARPRTTSPSATRPATATSASTSASSACATRRSSPRWPGRSWKRRATSWTCSRRRSAKSRSRCGASSTDVPAPPPWTRPRATSCTRATTTGSSISARKESARGLWKDSDVPKNQFPIGHPHEEMIVGQRAWRYWKEYLCVKRRYAGKSAL